MKKFLVGIISSLILIFSGSSFAAPPPGIIEDPTLNYLVTRVLPNGTEKVLQTGLVTEWGEQEQVIRNAILLFATQEKINNPSWRIIIYGPTDGWYWSNDDRIWDSSFNL